MSAAASRNEEVRRQFCRFYVFIIVCGVFRIFSEFELSAPIWDLASLEDVYDVVLDVVHGEFEIFDMDGFEDGYWKAKTDDLIDVGLHPRTRTVSWAIPDKNPNVTTVAYAVTITEFRSGINTPNTTLFDRAAVLHRSIKNAMDQSSRYDYDLFAFVHPDAIEVQPRMEQLGYKVLVRETPVNISRSQNKDLIKAQGSGCCGDKEYLKLYSYVLLDYPVVVHLDMDYLVLKPMEDIFDIMTDPSYHRPKFQQFSMWTDMQTYDGSIDFLFTRDYNMVNPPKRQPHQIGVQGGFLVVRPSTDDFNRIVSVIESGGNFQQYQGWGGFALKYGGYYGHGTIQGFASYYYGHLEPNRAIELNRCYYNTMVDNPIYHNTDADTKMCRTMEPDLNCQDCRETPLKDIYSAHFTLCGKPEHCAFDHPVPLCRELHRKWHWFRTLLEREWIQKHPEYYPGVAVIKNSFSNKRVEIMREFGNHCNPNYIPMTFPSETDKLI